MTEERLATPQVGDPVWDIQDDPFDPGSWVKITKVIADCQDGVWAVTLGDDPEERWIIFLGTQDEGRVQTWEVV